jgi:predicted HicB family RNase H-like nuclease
LPAAALAGSAEAKSDGEQVEQLLAHEDGEGGARKSLTSGATHSPRVQFRVPEAVATQAQDRARAEGKSLSELAREALLRYLAS